MATRSRLEDFLPRIDSGKCTGCKRCVRICPVFILRLGKMKKAEIVPERTPLCNRCGHCGAVCPEGAIAQPDLDLAAPELKKTAPVKPAAFHTLARERRSIRTYLKKPVPKEVLADLLDTAKYAPTGGNRQNVHYIVISSPEEIERLRDLSIGYIGRFIGLFRLSGAAALVSLAAKPALKEIVIRYLELYDIFQERWNKEREDRLFYNAPVIILAHANKWDVSSPFNCAAALYHIALKAHTLGMGTCFNGFLQLIANRSKKVNKFLGIPGDHRCYGALTLGYPQLKFKRLIHRKPAQVEWK